MQKGGHSRRSSVVPEASRIKEKKKEGRKERKEGRRKEREGGREERRRERKKERNLISLYLHQLVLSSRPSC